ncbi:transcriptional activator RinB [Staphylococcus hominis]|uniref:transcriptional activator RinB n=1 Tax=Staphylococcus hominis TaxID=1290 RepID=UPI001F55FEB1|nr:transcriptional activator RinB [Staphylococcus hominis]MCI2869467.1 transcriptional activator RinB [Staphylococcus hominis]MDS3893814.1 transcriptional activator RinB [Staphylococcus hominis]
MVIRTIFNTILAITVWEVGRHLLNSIIIKLESEDDIDTAPKDFALETDQFDLNRIKAEVSD